MAVETRKVNERINLHKFACNASRYWKMTFGKVLYFHINKASEMEMKSIESLLKWKRCDWNGGKLGERL